MPDATAWCGMGFMGRPLNVIAPDLGLSRPTSVHIKVDLPAPFAPMMAAISPSSISKLTSRRAWIASP